MKKPTVVLFAVGLIAVVSAGAYGAWWMGDYYGRRGDGDPTMSRWEFHGGNAVDFRESVRVEHVETSVNKPFNTLKASGDGLKSTTLPDGGGYRYCGGWSGWNTPGQFGTASQRRR